MMDRSYGQLTVYFEDPFRVGVLSGLQVESSLSVK